MKKPGIVAFILLIGVGLPLLAVDVWFNSIPASVPSGQSYYVEAGAYSYEGNWVELTLYKNGSWFANGNGFVAYANGYTTDYGQQTVEYFVDAMDWSSYEYASNYALVTITPPPNSAPFGTCDYTHGSIPTGGNMYGSGWAVDNEMGAAVARVDILIDGADVGDANLGGDRMDVANAYGRGDFRYSGWTFNYNIGGLGVGTHSIQFVAWDNQGASSSFGYRTFNVTNSVPAITLNSPAAQTIALGTTLTISSSATDADGNITHHHLDIQQPNGTWNWYGGFAFGEPFMGGPVGSGASSTRTATFTFNVVGTWYVRSWVNDSLSNNLHSATVPITVYDPNVAPTIAWSTQPTAYPNAGTSFTARATANDGNGNLSQVQVDVSVNGGPWSAFAYNGGGNGSTNTSDGNLVTAGAEGATYQFRARAFDSGGLSTSYINSTVAKINRTPSATLQVLDASLNAFPLGGNGRAQVPINTNYYIRISGSDPDGRLSILYERHVPVGGAMAVNQVSVSGASATHNFGPFNAGATAGFIDTWGHAQDADSGGYVTQGQGWFYVGGPDIDVNKLNQAAVTITSAGSFTYGNSFTATATGGQGGGALSWSLGTGSTAAGAAINASSGAVTANSSGTVVIKVCRLGDASYNDSSWSADYVISVGARPITISLTGAKTYNGSNVTSGISASISAGSLAPGDSIAYAYGVTPSVNSGSYPNLVTATISNPTSPTNRTTSYAITYGGSYTINKATLTVTANNAAKVYSAAVPAFTATYSGFVNGEIIAALSGSPALSTSATASSPVGNYSIAITMGTLAATNYQFSLVNGTLTITPQPITAATIAPFAYTGATQSPTASSSVMPSGATVTVSAPSQTNAGTYNTATVNGTGNYTGTLTNVSWTINPVAITGATIAPLPHTGSPQVPTTASVSPAGATYSISATAQTNPGTYTATVSGTSNYTGTINNVSWTINSIVITDAQITGLVYTGSPQSPSTLTSITPGGATATVTAPAQTNAGTYNTATVTGTGSYTGTLSNRSWTIAKVSQPGVTITSNTAPFYPSAYTATASGGSSGAGAYQWELRSGSTAPGAAINATSGAVTVSGPGTVVIGARRAGDTNYNDSAWTGNFTITFSTSAVTVSLGGSKTYEGTTASTGATASITTGALRSGDTITYSYASTSSAVPGAYTGLATATIRNSSNVDITAGYVITHAGSYLITPPATVPSGLRAWYSAEHGVTKDGLGIVSQWLDFSGNSLHLAQSDPAIQPIWSADVSNGKPAINFAGGDRLKSLVGNIHGGANDQTVIVVMRPSAAQTTDATVVDFDSAGQSGFSLRQYGSQTNQFALRWRNQTQTSWQGDYAPLVQAVQYMQIVTVVKEGTTQTAYRNGVVQGTSGVESSLHKPTAMLAVGGSVSTTGNYFDGWVAEILVYNRALTVTERQQVEAALLARYGLSATDADNDGLPDAWEMEHFGTLAYGPNDNYDGDPLTNLQEYNAGTNPKERLDGFPLPNGYDLVVRDIANGFHAIQKSNWQITPIAPP